MAAIWMLICGGVLSAMASFGFFISGTVERPREGAALLAAGVALQLTALALIYLAGVAQ